MADVTFKDTRYRADAPHGLATDTARGYCILPSRSNYHGMHVAMGDARYKILHSIGPSSGDVTELIPHARGFTISWADTRLETSMPHPATLRLDARGSFVLTLDCKSLHDESDVGREYTLKGANDAFIVRYRKHHDGRLADDNVAYELYIAVRTGLKVGNLGAWREVPYQYDDRRGTHAMRWVYDALSLSGTGTVLLAVGRTQEEAISRLQRIPRDGHQEPIHERDAPAAALLALRTDQGIMAGLPWFYQEWSRDELISMVGLPVEEHRGILDKWYRSVRADGTLPSIHPDQGLTSADAPGWLGKRTLDLLAREDVPLEMLVRWRDASGRLIDGLPYHDGLVWSEVNETWMDTAWQDDGRAGARIEIQALALALLDAHALLCKRTGVPPTAKRAAMHRAIVHAVHTRMVVDGALLDGLHTDGTPDHAARPNLFIAWYVQPRLLTRHQWAHAFDLVLPKLWLEWGGLSSIGTDDSRYAAYDSGEDTRAYHRGDSWYWVNNVAAMALHSVGMAIPAKQLIRGSMRDLTQQGIIGHVSEITSAAVQEPMGCWAQAWSAALLMEALRAVR